MKQGINHRVFKNRLTTLLGVLVVLAALASVFFAAQSWTTAVLGIIVGYGLIMGKDEWLKEVLNTLKP